MRSTMDFTKGPIVPELVRFAAPVALALLLQAAYGAVDLLVVGRYGNAGNVAAVSNGAQVMQMVTFVISDLAVGATILIGRALGRGEAGRIPSIIGSTVWVFGILSAVVMACMLPLAPLVAGLLRIPAASYDGFVAYVRICSAGAVCIAAYNVLGAVFRGMGNSLLPLITVAIASACNIVGDVILVGPFHMAERGAAVATVASQLVSVLVSLWLIRKLGLQVSMAKGEVKTALRIVRIGLPLALQNFLVSVSFLVIAAIVNVLGVVAAASVGVAEKICGFLMLVPSSMSQAMSAFVAQVSGAGDRRRAWAALRDGIAISLACGLAMALLAHFGGTALGGLFTTDMEVARGAGQYLNAYAVDCVLVSFLFCMIGFTTGLGYTGWVMVQGIVGAFGVRIPVSWCMSREVPPSLFHIGLATPCSSFVQILCFVGFFLWLRRRQSERR